MQIANSKVHLSSIPDTISALQTILARSQAIIPENLDTPYSNIPNTDHSAIELKDQSISAIVTERQQQLNTILHEISDLQTIMDSIKNLRHQLVKEKDKITRSMNLHKGLTSALWRLPTEVMSHIFVSCLPDTKHLSLAPKIAPMLLTRICRRWREIAVGIPSLWCRLSLSGDLQRAAFYYDSWLKRSRGRPLSLELKYFDHHLTKLRSLLQPYNNQISSLSIHFFRHPELLLTDLPALEDLTISICEPYAIPAIAQSISGQGLTLHGLKVMGMVFDLQRLSYFNPVWPQLKNVEIAIYQPNAVLHLLHLCPNLSSLTIRTAFDDIQALEPFTHTKLQSLRIDHNYAPTNRLSGLFNSLSLPNLRMLEARRIRTCPHQEFKALLVRSNCPLESLIFGAGVMTTDDQRAEYVALISSLKVVVDPKCCYAFA
ncbi:uncharacterized protein EDB91DRAFT_49244 [Suillus paluster]|uniref:uncharacterized protein n=1 Tax=Suillus paluster TaxID=48578 RepID=UPI001B87EB54|nr:uncharacterized protein EDB91DRAFT_49244 [Suillus paluster]KAG1747897.1 hypothetical protein EDB91DRAFT_49244 [Suillus paluster]